MSEKNKEHHKEHEKHSENKKKVEPIRRDNSSYNNTVWMYVAVFLAFLLFLSILTSGFKDFSLFSGVEVSNNSSNTKGFSLDGDYFLGSKDAKVTIIEFSDFQCPYCKRFYDQTFEALKEKYIDTGKVNFVYKHFPLNFHKQALPAAIAAECAGKQGKFYEMADLLYKKNSEWVPLNNPNSKFSSYAESLGLNKKDFEACLVSKDVLEKIQEDFNEGQAKGVSGTPAFFIGNEEQGFIRISGAQPLSVFEDAIEKILSGEKVNSLPEDPEKVFVTENNSVSLGSNNASIVMFEYSDFQCPFCKKFYFETFLDLKSNFIDTGKVKLVFKNFPLSSIHPMSSTVAQAALCAEEQKQGFFWKVHDVVFEKEHELNPKGTADFNASQLYSWLESIEGLNVSKVKECVDSGVYSSRIESETSEGLKNGIRGTPSFILLFNNNVDTEKLIPLQVPDGRGGYYIRFVEDQNGRKGFRIVGALPYNYFEKLLSIEQ